MTKGEVKRITGVIRRATGMRNIQTRIYELYNIILNNNLRRLKNLFEKELKRKASKVGSKNVVEQGRLDLNGQKIMAALKDNLDKIAYDDNGQVVVSQALFDRINDAMDRSYSEDKAVSNDAELELIGLSYARQYIEGVAASEKEEQDIKDSLKQADQSLADGKLDKKSHGEFVKEQARALAECRTERVKAPNSFRRFRICLLPAMTSPSNSWSRTRSALPRFIMRRIPTLKVFQPMSIRLN